MISCYDFSILKIFQHYALKKISLRIIGSLCCCRVQCAWFAIDPIKYPILVRPSFMKNRSTHPEYSEFELLWTSFFSVCSKYCLHVWVNFVNRTGSEDLYVTIWSHQCWVDTRALASGWRAVKSFMKSDLILNARVRSLFMPNPPLTADNHVSHHSSSLLGGWSSFGYPNSQKSPFTTPQFFVRSF